MTEFWDGSPYLVKYYRKAQRLKMEQENQIAWLNGLYIKVALDSSLANLFSKKGSKAVGYIDQPLDIFGKSEEEKRREAEAEREKAIAYFNRLIKAQKDRKKAQAKGDEIDVGND